MRKIKITNDGSYLILSQKDFSGFNPLPKTIEKMIKEGFKISDEAIELNSNGGFIHDSAKIAKTAKIDPSAIICKNAKIDGDVRIEKDCVIGDMTYIKSCKVVGKGTVLGIDTEIDIKKNIEPNVIIGRNNVIRALALTEDFSDTIISQNVVIEDHNIMQGIDYIGAYSVIESNMVSKDGPLRIGPYCQIGSCCHFTGRVFLGGSCEIGNRCNVMPGAIIKSKSSLKDDVYFGESSTLDGGVVLSEAVTLGKDCFIGNNTFVGDKTKFEANSGADHDCVIGKNVKIKTDTILAKNNKVKDGVTISYDAENAQSR